MRQDKQKVTATTCAYCGVGCGVEASSDGTAMTATAGLESHPANFGKLCVKGSSLHETTDLAGRLLNPQIDGKDVSWTEANQAVADGFKRIIDEHGPDSVAMYVSGQLLTEDYYVANKLMKGYIGSANIDTNSRLCMSSAVAGYKRAFGEDVVPTCYEDLELSDLLILVGSNAAWTHPILYQRMVEAKKRRPSMKIVVVDPRKTATCDIADLHLPIAPGSDAALYNGLLNYLNLHNGVDNDYIENHTEGFADVLDLVKSWDVERTAKDCDVDADSLAKLFGWALGSERTLSFYSMGINQSSSGVDKCNAIINFHLATGQIGQPGAGPFSITGQPNAMGGREVGGLANMLAAHMEIANPEHRDIVQRFWQSPTICETEGFKAVDLFDKIKSGDVKAVWIISTNPVVSLPDSNAVREALEKCELVVVQDCMEKTDTMAYADIALPAIAWGEKDGTVTNSERRISRQRSFLPAPGQARADWRIICDVATQMGFGEGFAFNSSRKVFCEHAALSGFENDDTRAFDISPLSALTKQQFNDLQPIQWPVTHDMPLGKQRMFADAKFYTPSGKARFIPITPRIPEQQPTTEFPIVLNSGRIRDQWHTMTRTGKASRLTNHIDEPYVEMNAACMAELELKDDDIALISAQEGKCLMRVKTSDDIKPKQAFSPIHWNAQFASNAGIGELYQPVVDPISGQPELKHAAVKITPFASEWQAMLITNQALIMPHSDYWVKVPEVECQRYELAGQGDLFDVLAAISEQFQFAQQIMFEDKQSGTFRFAWLRPNAHGKPSLVAVCYISNQRVAVERDWLVDLVNANELNDAQQRDILSGKPSLAGKSKGKMICSCMQVGENDIIDAICENGEDTLEALGKSLKCGITCGSCVPEIKGIIAKFKVSDAA